MIPIRVSIALVGVLLMAVSASVANAQWVQRRVCLPNGTCRVEWVPVRAIAPRLTAPLLAPPIVQDLRPEPFIVSPSADLQIAAAESLRIGDRQFVRTVRDASSEARKAGKISALQQARIMAAVRLTRLGREVEQLAAAEMQVEVSATGLIDWENFDPEKFLALIETILKILLLFGIGV